MTQNIKVHQVLDCLACSVFIILLALNVYKS